MTVKEQIWQMAQEMMEANDGAPVSSKDLMQRAEQAGIHGATARTQYGYWLKSEGAPLPETKMGRPKNEVKINASTDYAQAKADKERALADLRMMEVKARRRELLPAAEVEQTLAVAFAMVAQTLLSLPDTMERMSSLEPEQLDIMTDLLHTAMQALTDDLKSIGTVG